jgi:hypothetical protein
MMILMESWYFCCFQYNDFDYTFFPQHLGEAEWRFENVKVATWTSVATVSWSSGINFQNFCWKQWCMNLDIQFQHCFSLSCMAFFYNILYGFMSDYNFPFGMYSTTDLQM